MSRKWSLYRHTSPSGKVYIGITSRAIKKRWGNGYSSYKSCKAFYKAIIKYGWENIRHEVLFTDLEENRAKKLEIELIRHYKSLGRSYNISDGGDGLLGYCPSKETRLKLSEASKKHTPHRWSKEEKERMSLYRRTTYIESYHTEEFKRKISKAVEYKKVKVSQYTINDEFLASFNSANEAQKYTGVDRGAILRCCKGLNKTAKGYKWRFYG